MRFLKRSLLSLLLLTTSCAGVCKVEPSDVPVVVYSQKQQKELLTVFPTLPPLVQQFLKDYLQLRDRLRGSVQ